MLHVKKIPTKILVKIICGKLKSEYNSNLGMWEQIWGVKNIIPFVLKNKQLVSFCHFCHYACELLSVHRFTLLETPLLGMFGHLCWIWGSFFLVHSHCRLGPVHSGFISAEWMTYILLRGRGSHLVVDQETDMLVVRSVEVLMCTTIKRQNQGLDIWRQTLAEPLIRCSGFFLAANLSRAVSLGLRCPLLNISL